MVRILLVTVQRLKWSNEVTDYVSKMIALHHRPISLTKEEVTDSGVRRFLFEGGELVDDLMLLCRADITTSNKKKLNKYLDNFDKLSEKLVVVEEKDKLRNDETGWNKMSNALSNVFSSTLGLNKFEIDNSITISPNPSYGIIKIKGASIDNIQIFNILGQELIVVNNRNNKEIIIVDLHKSKQGIYYIRINLKNKIVRAIFAIILFVILWVIFLFLSLSFL